MIAQSGTASHPCVSGYDVHLATVWSEDDEAAAAKLSLLPFHFVAKVCTACDKPLPWSAYGADKRASDGRQSACLSCQAARRRECRLIRRIAGLLADAAAVGVTLSRPDAYALISSEANGRCVNRQLVIRLAGLVPCPGLGGTASYAFPADAEIAERRYLDRVLRLDRDAARRAKSRPPFVGHLFPVKKSS